MIAKATCPSVMCKGLREPAVKKRYFQGDAPIIVCQKAPPNLAGAVYSCLPAKIQF